MNSTKIQTCQHILVEENRIATEQKSARKLWWKKNWDCYLPLFLCPVLPGAKWSLQAASPRLRQPSPSTLDAPATRPSADAIQECPQ